MFRRILAPALASVVSAVSVTPAVLAALALGLAAACYGARSPELRVLGVHEEPRHDVVFVQVTNPASRSMRLTKLEYTFAADGATVSVGEVSLAREVPAGAAVVVEIPLDTPSEKPMTLSGKLTAELNQVVQIFPVSAQIHPSR
jgi:LEA14-like dessication related protein